MTQEIQLASNKGLTADIEPWNQPGALGPASQTTPLHHIQRSLRGRYLLAFLLATIGAVAGAAAGWLLPKPTYKSVGQIAINYLTPSLETPLDRIMPMYQAFVQMQVVRLQSDRLINQAVQSEAWRGVHPQGAPDEVANFGSALTVKPPIGQNTIIEVNFQDPSPTVASAGVKAVISTYDRFFKGMDTQGTDKKLASWKEIRERANDDIRLARKDILKLTQDYGYDDLSDMVKSRWGETIQIEKMVSQAKLQYDQAQQDSKTGPQLSVADIAKVDTFMAGLVRRKEQADAQLSLLQLGNMGPNSPVIIAASNNVTASEKQIDTYAQKFRAEHGPAVYNLEGNITRVLPKDMEDLKQSVEKLEKHYNEYRAKTAEIGHVNQQIANAKNTIKDKEEQLHVADARIRELEYLRDSIGEVIILSDGSANPTPVDNRLKFSLLGFMCGGGIPLMLVMMFGLLDHRYRFSDETGTEMQGITLLGILPNLPDRLSDPEQAAIAAHCVHQIRTMLQINGGPDERRVFAVTSASSGDGKTSLTLALGLSYAACGTRTLLIDCDLVGGGLSSRMNVSSPEGVLEAIANRSLLEYVRTTDIADVSVLPVGSAHGYHASTLSPQSLRRLIDEAKAQYEIILIDTGPILGSIEASLVCAASDGVVLTVARGQQRPLVEKSLAHLRNIGARLAGVVFNRAQADDFERSMSGVSMRSVARPNNGNGSGDGQFGPVARAVAAQRKPTATN